LQTDVVISNEVNLRSLEFFHRNAIAMEPVDLAINASNRLLYLLRRCSDVDRKQRALKPKNHARIDAVSEALSVAKLVKEPAALP
jgi:hypothetical protein